MYKIALITGTSSGLGETIAKHLLANDWASKYGLTAFAGVLGKELRGESIKVTSIHPGGINTPMWDSNKDFHTDLTKLIDPQQIADMITFICNSQQNIEYKTIKMFPDIEWHN
jgi:NADP-dependent 3-hydroxy acid dehydrogenase YdfG